MASGKSNDPYSRLDFDGPVPPAYEDSSDDETGPLTQPPRHTPQPHQQQQAYDPHYSSTSPTATMDPRYRTPSPGHPLAGYQRDEEQPYRPQRQNTGGYPGGSTQMPDWPDDGDRLMAQPTVSLRWNSIFFTICLWLCLLVSHYKVLFFVAILSTDMNSSIRFQTYHIRITKLPHSLLRELGIAHPPAPLMYHTRTHSTLKTTATTIPWTRINLIRRTIHTH